MKKLLTIAIAALLVMPLMVSAKDMTQKWGLGYFNSDAPVGVRFWVNEKVGVDVGGGFEVKDLSAFVLEDTAAGDTVIDESAMNFWIDVGIPIVVVPTERANFWVRPGGTLAILDNRLINLQNFDETWTEITLSLVLAGEVFFGDNFSLEAGHGLQVTITSPPDVISSDSRTDFSTVSGNNLFNDVFFAFHFYFK